MELAALLELMKLGVVQALAVLLVWWLIQRDIPAREERHREERKMWAETFLEATREMTAENRKDREEIVAAIGKDREETLAAIRELGKQ